MQAGSSCVERGEAIAGVRVLANICQSELVEACGIVDSMAAQRRDKIFVDESGF